MAWIRSTKRAVARSLQRAFLWVTWLWSLVLLSGIELLLRIRPTALEVRWAHCCRRVVRAIREH